MATLRLRKAFHYPEDSDDGNGREELDEEEQEQVINRLQRANEKGNEEYKLIFAVIPLVPLTAFVPSIFSGSTTAYEWLLCLLGMISLISTSYIMKQLPLHHPGRAGKTPRMNIRSRAPALQKHVISVNAVACSLLTLAYCFANTIGLSYNVRPVLYLVPGVMFLAILVVRKVMVSVDITILRNLRYEYKGV